jgi:HD-GYP domain-containing protein (c-di-GMP phosphodiesterase class II)
LAKTSTPVTTGNIGRLSRPEVDRPVSQAGFDRLARHWRELGVWLSLWDRRGEVLAVDEQAGRFWNLLWSHGSRFRDELAAVVRAAGDLQGRREAEEAASISPWRPDLALFAAPVRQRQRVVGIILGAALVTDPPGEGLARLCSQCGLDFQSLVQAAEETTPVGEETGRRLAPLFQLTVRQLRELEAGCEEAAVLTQNLENTYEEQHLIYQISGMMGLPQKPAGMLERVGQELLEVSRARGVAFVLSEQAFTESAPGRNDDRLDRDIGDRIVQLGEGAPNLSELDRLAECLDYQQAVQTGYLLLNDVSQQPAFAWTRPWLKHLMALPFCHERRLLGVMLAVNCSDEGDYTSVDVQLFRAVADRVAAFLVNQHLYDDLADLLMGLLHALVNSIDAKDQYTCGHSERVAFISRTLAQAAGLSRAECQRIYLGGLLHDIGKIGVPDAILCKPGRLTEAEFDAMKKHPEIGAKILSRVRQIADLTPGVLHHHERMDARGYPYGLAGRTTPLLGRIICLADCFDAMTTDRTYRAAMPLPTVIAEIRRCSGTQFDPELAERFLKLDLARVMKEARECSQGDPSMGHLGALSPAMSGPPSPQAS